MSGSRGRLEGKVALVAGASRGIGRAVALRFASEGARVAVAARSADELAAVARACGPGSLALHLDVAQERSCEDAVHECERSLGPIDALVVSSGIATSSKFTDIDTDTWHRILRVDLDGPFWLTRAALPGMLVRRSGAVIMIASTAAKAGAPYVAAYTAAKHALLGMTRSLAAEYAKSGLTFNCVCPSYVDTPMTEETIARIVERTGRTPEQARAALLNPQGRLIAPDEIAAVCVLLASEEGRAMNGQAINIDGGQLQS